MIAARQELDLRPQLERLDRLICWSEDIDEGALSFAFRPLWQLDEPARAALALSRAQATQVYAGLKLWPDAVVARLAEAQLVADGTYPNAAAVFAEGGTIEAPQITTDAFPFRPGFDPNEPRGPDGRWTAGGSSTPTSLVIPVVQQINEDPDPTPEEEQKEIEERIKQREDPQRFFRQGLGPDGTVRIPIRPGGGAPPAKSPSIGGESERPTPPVTPQPSADPGQTTPLSGPKSDAAIKSNVSPPINTSPTQRPNAPSSQSARPNDLELPGEQPRTHGASEALASIGVPSNLKLEAQGRSFAAQGHFYEEEVRKALDFDAVPKPKGRTYEKGETAPDGLATVPGTGLQIALEVKYFNGSTRGINDPDNMLKFITEGDVAQARKYLDKYKGVLLLVVNDKELIYKYDYFFRKNGLSGYRIDYIDSK